MLQVNDKCDDTVDDNKKLCSAIFKKLNELCEPRQRPIGMLRMGLHMQT